MKVGALRGVHNASMTILMLLAAAWAYEAAGGEHPLTALSGADVVPLAAMALVAQAVNVLLMALFWRFDGRDVRRVIRPVYSLMDLIFVPTGVLAALLFNSAPPAVFGLFVALMVVLVLSFNGVGRSLSAAGARAQSSISTGSPRSTTQPNSPTLRGLVRGGRRMPRLSWTRMCSVSERRSASAR